MRIIKTYLLLTFTVIALFSCEKFLNVKPKDQITREDVISRQQTYYDALNGIYLMLGNENLFGHNLTYGIIEQIARNHAIKPSAQIFYWGYSTTEVRPIMDAIWNSMYSVIANINSLLDEIDNNKNIFEKDIYELLKAELLTIRANSHYTLVKLYAPDYNQSPSARGIPYRTVYKNPLITPFSSVEKVYEKILVDLKEAEILFSDCDPAIGGFGWYGGESNIIGGETIKKNRRIRFNYWANIAIQARVNLSMSKFQQAYECSNKIINSKDIFNWIEKRYISNDALFYPEIISAIQIPNLKSSYENYFKSQTYVTTQDNNDYIGNQVFNISGEGSFDYRLDLFDKIPNSSNTAMIYRTSKKYFQLNTSNLPIYSGYLLVPIVKYSEMFLISAEASAMINNDDLTEAISILEQLRTNRGVVAKMDKDMSKDDIISYIIQEYRRELYLEGQLFYHYKRHNIKRMPDLTSLGYMDTTKETYLFPVPDVEIEENK